MSKQHKDNWLEEQLAEIKKTADLRHNWDGLESDPPNPWAQNWIEKIVRFQHSIGFCKGIVTPDHEGGLKIGIQEGNIYADICVLNRGEILPLTDEGKEGIEGLECWNIEPNEADIQKAVRQIKSFLKHGRRS
ncbi:MAG: hypothetical protein K2Y22_06545 [Candidatus Obscuribacterales bacterium]|nr:hypothetical protein [Candidatus Obscuribacterales bacterium]